MFSGRCATEPTSKCFEAREDWRGLALNKQAFKSTIMRTSHAIDVIYEHRVAKPVLCLDNMILRHVVIVVDGGALR